MMDQNSIDNGNGDFSFQPFAHFATLAIHAGQEPEQWESRAVVPPISLATTFKQEEPGKHAVGWF
jgi:cystathionine gamma-lyase